MSSLKVVSGPSVPSLSIPCFGCEFIAVSELALCAHLNQQHRGWIASFFLNNYREKEAA
jgi:hypothetical protein